METVNVTAEIRGFTDPVGLIDKATMDIELAIVRRVEASVTLQKLRMVEHGKVFATGYRRVDFERRVRKTDSRFRKFCL